MSSYGITRCEHVHSLYGHICDRERGHIGPHTTNTADWANTIEWSDGDGTYPKAGAA